MKKILSLISTLIITGTIQASTMTQKMYITINGRTMAATLVDNSSTQALVEALSHGDITYEAHDYGNFEKVGALGISLPQNNEQITTQPGDIILYQGNNLCIYYDTNSWNFTRIGRIDEATQTSIKEFVNAGGGNVSVTLSLSQPTGITNIKADEVASKSYTLSGMTATNSTKGVIVKEGRKTVKK